MRKAWLLFSQTVTIAVALLFVVATLKPQWLDRGSSRAAPPSFAVVPLPPPVQSVSLPGPGVAATSYSAAAKRASPAVVSITASHAAVRRPRTGDPLFDLFGGQARQGPEERQLGLGSGVIVSSAGYLLTNN
ncbi:MAG TPA: 2-alkenal reductase, partial [Caldimonas sp.]|nr:2-alkenal reductase [Caldimonas sp.]